MGARLPRDPHRPRQPRWFGVAYLLRVEASLTASKSPVRRRAALFTENLGDHGTISAHEPRHGYFNSRGVRVVRRRHALVLGPRRSLNRESDAARGGRPRPIAAGDLVGGLCLR